ncbi:MAG: hypothetical protein ABI747_01780 [Candidatus Moraniibacteriota bacterium]
MKRKEKEKNLGFFVKTIFLSSKTEEEKVSDFIDRPKNKDMYDTPAEPLSTDEGDRSGKIQSLREMILNAEKTIQGAKAMLLQIEGKKKTGRPKKMENPTDGIVVEGAFDGQIMFGTDGKQYPVPANYASKSKLVEGDMLKLTITPDGSFIYKQIGPIERRHAIGIVSQDENGNYHIVVEGEPFRVLLASITYFRASPGDEVAVVMPRDLKCSWAAIENILQKGALSDAPKIEKPKKVPAIDDWKKDLAPSGKATPIEEPASTSGFTINPSSSHEASPLDDWVRDMEKIKEEIQSENKN